MDKKEEAPAKPEKKPEDMTREELLDYCKVAFGSHWELLSPIGETGESRFCNFVSF